MARTHYTLNTLSNDVLAGITGAVAGAPQAMGFAIVAGVGPLYGLYAAFVPTIIGGIFGSSRFITVGPTNALALVVASALGMFAGPDQLPAMFMLTILTGVFLLLIGVFQLGNLTRFVSKAVMTGFVTGAGLLIMLGQLNHLTGYEPAQRSSVPLVRFWDWLVHLDESLIHIIIVGLLSVALIWGLHHTRLKSVATLVAIILITVAIALLGWTDVPTVADMSLIPSGLPEIILPDLSLAPELITTAFAMSILAAVQSAALIQAIHDPDNNSNISQDFIAMGMANIAGGLVRGMPSCASLSRTAVNVSAGAKTRLANIFAGLFVGVILLVLGGWIERIPLAVLAGHLVVAAASLIQPSDLRMVWQVGSSARVAMVATLLATLLLPLQYSIYIGVGLSLVLYIYTSSEKITVGRLVPQGDGTYRRESIPAQLPPDAAIIFSISGNLYFAAIRRLESLLPDPTSGKRTVVILRMRENPYLGITGIHFLREYAEGLRSGGGQLLLSGVTPEVQAQLERTDMDNWLGADNLFWETDIVLGSTGRAYARAQQILSDSSCIVGLQPTS